MPDWAKARSGTAGDPELKSWIQQLRAKWLGKFNARDGKLKQAGE
jgi:hypothetical protein